VFVNARAALQDVLFEHTDLSHASAPLGAAVNQALLLMKASGDKADPRLVQAASGRIIPFLIDLAQNKPASGGLDISNFDRDYWADKPANQTWIKDRFRGSGGEHEWIPTSYVMKVVARAREARDVEGMEAAAAWVTFQNELRSPTKILMYPPKGRYERSVPHPRDPISHVTKSGQALGVLQGHVGAVYAPVREDTYSEDVIAQTRGQQEWHNDLRHIFASNTGTDLATMGNIVEQLETFVDTDVWNGKKFTNPGFNEYYTAVRSAADGNDVVTFAALETLASSSHKAIKSDFDRAHAAAANVL
jgi:hypothetical protein